MPHLRAVERPHCHLVLELPELLNEVEPRVLRSVRVLLVVFHHEQHCNTRVRPPLVAAAGAFLVEPLERHDPDSVLRRRHTDGSLRPPAEHARGQRLHCPRAEGREVSVDEFLRRHVCHSATPPEGRRRAPGTRAQSWASRCQAPVAGMGAWGWSPASPSAPAR